MKLKTDGLILKAQNIGEQDKLVTVLTRDCGVIRAFVRGAKNMKSSKSAATQTLTYSRFVVYTGRDTYSLDDAVSEEMFISLRNDLESLSLAQYLSEVIMTVAPEHVEAPDFLRLILNALYLLSEKKRPPLLIKSAFEMRAMSLAGYMPDLVACQNCKCYEAEPMYFLPKRGMIFCEDCVSLDGELKIPLNPGVLTSLRHTIYADFNKVFNFALPDDSLKILNMATEQYLLYTLEKDFKTLTFYKSLNQLN
ncbi:MAG: DNA repair protein RecO [Bacillota bacterium]|nr:DNA repair protein RecO [Bacillota bacterium]